MMQDLRATIMAAIQAANAKPPVPVDGLSFGAAWVRAFTVQDMDAQSARRAGGGTDADGVAFSLAQCLCDNAGVCLFDASNPADVALLNSMDWPSAAKILRIANRDLGDVDAKKGSPAGQSS